MWPPIAASVWTAPAVILPRHWSTDIASCAFAAVRTVVAGGTRAFPRPLYTQFPTPDSYSTIMARCGDLGHKPAHGVRCPVRDCQIAVKPSDQTNPRAGVQSLDCLAYQGWGIHPIQPGVITPGPAMTGDSRSGGQPGMPPFAAGLWIPSPPLRSDVCVSVRGEDPQ